MEEKIVLDNGKYTIINELDKGGGLRALRHGEEWRNLNGDGLVLALVHEIERLREINTIYVDELKQTALDVGDFYGGQYALSAMKALDKGALLI